MWNTSDHSESMMSQSFKVWIYFDVSFWISGLSSLCPPLQSLLLASEMKCSGGALVNHSYQDPSYTDAPGEPHRWAASTTWQAVTPEPQVPHMGLPRSTPDFSKNCFSRSVESIMPSSSKNLKKGMHLEPGMWPGSTPVGWWHVTFLDLYGTQKNQF